MQEIAKADPNDIFLQIGNALGMLMDEFDKIGAILVQQEAQGKAVYAGTESIGKRAITRIIIRARLDAIRTELREMMVYQAPKELGDLWHQYQDMWDKVVAEQDVAVKRETARLQIEASKKRRLIRRRWEYAVWFGAILFVVVWFLGVLLLLRGSLTYRLLSSYVWR